MDTSNFKDKLGYDFSLEVVDPVLKDNPEVQKWLDEVVVIIKKELIKKKNIEAELDARRDLLCYGFASQFIPNEEVK
jgi:hypothetical protein